MGNFKNIIFDLGGVIINLDVPKTIREFENLGFFGFSGLYTQAQQSPLFDAFDKGGVSPEEFFDTLKKTQNTPVDTYALIRAWNAMLLDFPLHRLQLLEKAAKQYRTFLLSNTNETHVSAFEAILEQQHGIPNLQAYFEKVYYSCRMNMRKPDTEIFNYVLQENGLIPAETIFIDDSPQHVAGARLCGIEAVLLEKRSDIGELLKELKLL